MLNDHTHQTVIATKVAAELYHAQQITRSLSISSKNLRILAKRIGESAAGLAVLATFYDEFSRESITLANLVTAMTVKTATTAVNEWRYSLFEENLEKAREKMAADRVPDIVTQVLTAKPLRELLSKEHISNFNRELNDLLVSIQKKIRSIAVIAVNSKIEAPRTGSHSPVLLDMAQNVEEMIKLILKHIDNALKFLAKNQQFI